MKKILLLLMIVAGAAYARAQSTPRLLPPNSASPYAVKPWEPVTMDSVLKFNHGKDLVVTPSPIKNDDHVVFYSRMPVAKPGKGNSRMPVADLNKTYMRYTMPVAKVYIVNPDTVGVERVMP